MLKHLVSLRAGNAGRIPAHFPIELHPTTLRERAHNQYHLDPDDADDARILDSVGQHAAAILDQYDTTVQALDAIYALQPQGGPVPMGALAEKVEIIDSVHAKACQRADVVTTALTQQQQLADAEVELKIKPSADMLPYGQEVRSHYKAMPDTLKGPELMKMARAGDPLVALIVAAPAALSGINAETHAQLKKLYGEAVAPKAFRRSLACARLAETITSKSMGLIDNLESASRVKLKELRLYRAQQAKAAELKKKLGAM